MSRNTSHKRKNVSNKEEDSTWPDLKVRILLSLYLANIEDFRNPHCKKWEIWQRISDQVGNSIDSCDRKFRNLKHYYIGLLKRKMKTGCAVFTWPYFQIFEDIFREDATLYPEKNKRIIDTMNVSDSLEDDSLLQCEEDKEDDNDDVESLSSEASTEAKRVCNIRQLHNNEAKKTRKIELENIHRLAEDTNRRHEAINVRLDQLIEEIEESNVIQRERNELFEKYYEIITRQK